MEFIIFFVLTISLIGYTLFVSVALYGWYKTFQLLPNGFNFEESRIKLLDETSNNGVSIIIPFRNEALNLRSLLLQPAFNSNEGTRFELILVDDHSNDDWLNTVDDLLDCVKVLKNDGIGKKSAILTGVKASSFDTILTTDADCYLPVDWITSMVQVKYRSNASLVFGGVKLLNNGTILGDFQSIDYSSMASIGAGYASINLPFLCSGANLMFDKEAYLSVVDKLKLDYLSGDDVFLLHAFSDRSLNIAFANNYQAIVLSSCQSSFRGLVNQRIRWGSKAVLYTNCTAILASLVVFLVNISLVISLFILIFYSQLAPFVLLAYFLKSSIDILFFRITNRFWRNRISLIGLIITTLLYPFWISIISLFGFISRGKWKGR